MKKHLLYIGFIVVVLFVIMSCDRDFEYSVYSEYVVEHKEHTTRKNLEKIQDSTTLPFTPFKICLISDNHLYYDDLNDVMDVLNKHNDYDFMIHGGDISDNGVAKEFSISWDILSKSKIPYFTVIGNHDILANGKGVYDQMYGPLNYSFVYKNCKFIFFDDIIWGSTVLDPDFMWLKQELDTNNNYKYTFLIAHIPQWTDQFYPSQRMVFNYLLSKSKVTLCIYGHLHTAEQDVDTLENGYISKSMIIGTVNNRTYRELIVGKDSVSFKSIPF